MDPALAACVQLALGEGADRRPRRRDGAGSREQVAAALGIEHDGSLPPPPAEIERFHPELAHAPSVALRGQPRAVMSGVPLATVGAL